MAKLLSIDDDRSVHHLVARVMEPLGIAVAPALTATEGIACLEEVAPDVVLLDVMLPDMSGLDAFKLIREKDQRLPVIIATAAGSSDTAIEAMKLGAFDYLTKPIDVRQLEHLVTQAIESRRLAKVPVGMAHLTAPADSADSFVGRCPAMQEVFKAIGRVAQQDVPVLIRGDSGTGKELVARAIFQHGARSNGPFLAVNCAALSETLLESELFGHEKGSFTGAHDRRIGKFEQCNGGTIFLDEVGDMSPAVQAKVLRLLQQQTFERVGGNQTIETDVRIVSATNRDLEEMCAAGEFRNDLYYRLNGYTIALPALRDRGDDRVLLLQHFLAQLNRELGADVQGISPGAMQRLLDYDWPGNVRELQSVVKQAMLHCSGPVLMESALPADIQAAALRTPGTRGLNGSTGESSFTPDSSDSEAGGNPLAEFVNLKLASGGGNLYADTLEYMERELLSRVLSHASGNQSEAARILGITRGSLRNKIRSNGITIGSDIKIEG